MNELDTFESAAVVPMVLGGHVVKNVVIIFRDSEGVPDDIVLSGLEACALYARLVEVLFNWGA